MILVSLVGKLQPGVQCLFGNKNVNSTFPFQSPVYTAHSTLHSVDSHKTGNCTLKNFLLDKNMGYKCRCVKQNRKCELLIV